MEIEAVQFTGDNEAEITTFTSVQKFMLVDEEDREDDPDIIASVWDKLHGTWVGVKKGQWIIRGIEGEFYPCADSVFRATYEEV